MTPQPSRWIEYVPLRELREAEENPKLHDLETLADSVGRFGYVEPITVDERTGRLVAGHGRRITLLSTWESGDAPPDGVHTDEDGEWLVPVVRGWASADDDEADAYLLASNRTSELGGWEAEPLSGMLSRLAAGSGLEGTGYTNSDVIDWAALTAPPVDLDALAEELGPPSEEDFSKNLAFRLPPALFARWVQATATTPGDDTAKLLALLDRVESCTCS